MNTLVPIQFYTLLFYSFILLVAFVAFLQSGNTEIGSITNRNRKNFIGLFILVFTILYMGLRPLSYRFGDMVIYNAQLQSISRGNELYGNVEYLFGLLMLFFGNIGSSGLFFFVCAFLYVFPLYIVTKQLFRDYWFYGFLMIISAFTFWEFGVNGIRNGIAGSVFLLAIVQRKSVFKYGLFVVAILTHKSLILPIAAYIASTYIKNIKLYFLFWILCIPLSLALGSFLESFFLGLGFSDDAKINVYLGEFDQDNALVVLKEGFRWDFVIYSATAVFAAWYYIFKKKVDDVFYNHIVSVYLLSNGFWILIIRANYSNRFAYLSWFMMGIVILYPILKYQLLKKQHVSVSAIIISFCALGYLLNVILA